MLSKGDRAKQLGTPVEVVYVVELDVVVVRVELPVPVDELERALEPVFEEEGRVVVTVGVIVVVVVDPAMLRMMLYTTAALAPPQLCWLLLIHGTLQLPNGARVADGKIWFEHRQNRLATQK